MAGNFLGIITEISVEQITKIRIMIECNLITKEEARQMLGLEEASKELVAAQASQADAEAIAQPDKPA